MAEMEAARTMSMQRKRQELDYKVEMTMDQKSKQLMVTKVQQDTIREDRVKTVERIQRKQDYHRQQIMKKIEKDNKKSQDLKSEKEQLMETRKVMKQ